MADSEKIKYTDIIDNSVSAGLSKMISELKEVESSLRAIRKMGLKVDGGSGAVASNEKLIAESLKNQKILADIEQKRIKLIEKQRLEEIRIQQAREKAFDDYEKRLQKQEAAQKKAAESVVKNLEKQRLEEIKLQKAREKAFDDFEKQQKAKEKKLEQESREYVQLSKAHSQAANTLKDLIVRGKTATQTQKEFDNELKNAQLQFNLLHSKILQADHAVGQFNRNVGNYPKIKEFFMGLAGAAGIGLGIDAVFDLGKEIFNVTGKFEKYNAMLVQTLGTQQQATEAMNLIKDIAKQTPFSVDELTNSYIKLKNRGIDPTKETILAFGDIASSTGKSFDQFAEAVLDAQTGEFERLKEFGITAKKQGDNVAMTFKGQTQTVKFTKDAITEYLTELGKIKGVAGSMAAVSATLEGKISNLGDAWDNLLVSFGSGEANDALKWLIDLTTEIINSFTAGNALTETIKNLFNQFQNFISALGSLMANLIPVSDKTMEVNDIFEILSTTLEITTYPLRLLIDALTWLYETADYVIDNFTPLNELLNFSAEIFGQVAKAITTADDELNKYAKTNLKFGVVSKAILDLLNVTIAEMLGLGDVQKANTKTTDDLTDANNKLNKTLIKRSEIMNSLKESVMTSVNEDFMREIVGDIQLLDLNLNKISQNIKKYNFAEKLNSALLNTFKTAGDEGATEFDKMLMKIFEVEPEALENLKDELKQALSEIAEQGNALFETVNEANQQQTQNLIDESDKRIEILQSEYDKEKELQEQRQQDGKAYDQKRLNEIKQSIAKENAEKAKQVEELKKFQRRAILVQLAADNAKAISAAISGGALTSGGNPILFAINLAAMLLQIGTAFTKAKASLAELDKYEEGGWIEGKSHKEGGKVIEAEGGEHITAKKYAAQSSMILNAVNSGELNDKMLYPILRGSVSSNNSFVFDNSRLETLLNENNSLTSQQLKELQVKEYFSNNKRIVKSKGLTTIFV